jgi:outer membrane protein OmpA-like peptidoglycan-associated protein/formylmethanofuran dehydrogenase subunit D
VSILNSLSSKKGGFKQGAVALNGGESLPAQFIEATTETNDAAVRAAFSFASDNEAIRAISKENISSVYKLGVDGDSNNIKISPEMARALSIREGDSIYVVSHGGKTLLFNSAEKFKNFSDALKAGGIEILPEDVKIVKVQSGLKLPIKEMSKTGSSFKSGAIAVDHFGITELIETPSSVSGAKILKSALLEISEDPVSEKQFSSSLTFVPESVSDDKAQAAYILSTDEQNLKISREMGGAISILEGDQIYVVNYGGQTYLFTDRSKLQNFEYELRNQGAAPYDYSVDAVRVQKGMTISLNDLTPGDKGQALAKFRGGAIALEYDGVTRLIGASFEEDAYASAASKEAPLQSLAQGKVLGVWKLKTEFGNIKISPEMAKGLAVKEGGNLYFITYGARTFLFADKAKMLEFENKLKKSGAAVEASDINVAAIEPGWEFPVKAIGRADADFSHGAVVVQHNANIAEILEDADTTLKPSMYEGTRIAGRPKDKDGGRIDSISAKTKDKDAYKKIQAGSTDKYGYYYKGKDAADAEAGGKSTYFGFDKSYVTPEGKDLIEALAERLKGKKYNITVQGHTDSIGTREYNQKLSERRAEAVRRELISKGLDATKIDIAGFGEDKPIADNSTPQGRAKNRRAVIFVEIE